MMRMIVGSTMLACTLVGTAFAQTASTPSPSARPPIRRNWSPPAYTLKAQAIVDELMAQHPELIGVTMHGRPPGMNDFTMFAASYHDRIGKVSGPDDVMALTLGRIMVETRYAPTDNPRKVVVLIPLQDKAGDDVATIVFGFHDDVGSVKAAAYYVSCAIQLRDSLRAKIDSNDDLFSRVK